MGSTDKLLSLSMVSGSVGILVATAADAFATVEPDRTADVDVAGDANALLAITPAAGYLNSSFIDRDETQDRPN
jgi:hypothetical protein